MSENEKLLPVTGLFPELDGVQGFLVAEFKSAYSQYIPEQLEQNWRLVQHNLPETRLYSPTGRLFNDVVSIKHKFSITNTERGSILQNYNLVLERIITREARPDDKYTRETFNYLHIADAKDAIDIIKYRLVLSQDKYTAIKKTLGLTRQICKRTYTLNSPSVAIQLDAEFYPRTVSNSVKKLKYMHFDEVGMNLGAGKSFNVDFDEIRSAFPGVPLDLIGNTVYARQQLFTHVIQKGLTGPSNVNLY
jgi:hypothetical protein